MVLADPILADKKTHSDIILAIRSQKLHCIKTVQAKVRDNLSVEKTINKGNLTKKKKTFDAQLR